YRQLRPLDSFPTRRSSDLLRTVGPHRASHVDMRPGHVLGDERLDEVRTRARAWRGAVAGVLDVGDRGFDRLGIARVERQAPDRRSEEHTSELQSRENLVCR